MYDKYHKPQVASPNISGRLIAVGKLWKRLLLGVVVLLAVRLLIVDHSSSRERVGKSETMPEQDGAFINFKPSKFNPKQRPSSLNITGGRESSGNKSFAFPSFDQVLFPLPKLNDINDTGKYQQQSADTSSPKKRVNRADAQSQAYIKDMMIHAWGSYVKFAFGKDELRPQSKSGKSWIDGSGYAATVLDSLDTLWIMDMKEDFEIARKYVEDQLTFDVQGGVSVFETNIRVVGGLLSAYDLSGHKIFLERAVQIVERLLPAYNTKTGIPNSMIDLHSGSSYRHGWTSGYVLSEYGSMLLEFQHLSDLTGNQTYEQVAMKPMDYVLGKELSIKGLYPTNIDENGQWVSGQYTVGALSDSFYEYLLKLWVIGDMKDSKWRHAWDESAVAIEKYLVGKTQSGDVYLTSGTELWKSDDMEHLTCFAGGMFALAARTLEDEYTDRWFQLGADLTETCYKMYKTQPLGISAEKTRITDYNAIVKYYIQRPEAVESIFYMWRYTHDEKYRQWGMEIAQAINKCCKVEGGYTGLNDMTADPLQRNDQQESFFLAETLKYLYLLFSDDDLISLDDYVFNTEAHPFLKRSRLQK
ncbi:hypothetical protein MP228_012461 [Amoeboaphelidium protococcarum]|nr:hypothetical protein MP228_012461 [Amoeboaphelidium protococcarum]